MKNKALTYLLIAVVGFIWYKVFFRVKGSLFGDEVQIVQPNNPRTRYQVTSRDTFPLQANYRDPFGETKPTPVSNSEEIPSAPPIERRPTPKPVISWPQIKYFGQVRKTTSSKPLAIISIDGYQHTLRKGESIYDGIEIKAIGRDSIVIKYNKENRVFWRD